MSGHGRRGVIYTASTMMLFVAVLVFSVLVYQAQERGEELVAANTIATRVISLEQSVSYSVRDILFTLYRLDFSEHIVDDSVSLHLKTTLQNDAGGDIQQAVQGNLSMLASRVSSIGVSFDADAVHGVLLQRGASVAFQKNHTDDNEYLTIYYNASGAAHDVFSSIGLFVGGYVAMNDVDSLGFEPPPGGYVLNISYNNYNCQSFPCSFLNEEPDASEIISFGQIDEGNSYLWAVRNSITDTHYAIITLDHEKVQVEITNEVQAINLTSTIVTSRNHILPYFYLAPYVLSISFPHFETTKHGRLIFT